MATTIYAEIFKNDQGHYQSEQVNVDEHGNATRGHGGNRSGLVEALREPLRINGFALDQSGTHTPLHQGVFEIWKKQVP